MSDNHQVGMIFSMTNNANNSIDRLGLNFYVLNGNKGSIAYAMSCSPSVLYKPFILKDIY